MILLLNALLTALKGFSLSPATGKSRGARCRGWTQCPACGAREPDAELLDVERSATAALAELLTTLGDSSIGNIETAAKFEHAVGAKPRNRPQVDIIEGGRKLEGGRIAVMPLWCQSSD